MIGQLQLLIEDIRSGKYNKIEAAHKFEDAVIAADKECKVHIEQGQKNYPNQLNSLLLELRAAIQSKFTINAPQDVYFEDAIAKENQ